MLKQKATNRSRVYAVLMFSVRGYFLWVSVVRNVCAPPLGHPAPTHPLRLPYCGHSWGKRARLCAVDKDTTPGRGIVDGHAPARRGVQGSQSVSRRRGRIASTPSRIHRSRRVESIEYREALTVESSFWMSRWRVRIGSPRFARAPASVCTGTARFRSPKTDRLAPSLSRFCECDAGRRSAVGTQCRSLRRLASTWLGGETDVLRCVL